MRFKVIEPAPSVPQALKTRNHAARGQLHVGGAAPSPQPSLRGRGSARAGQAVMQSRFDRLAPALPYSLSPYSAVALVEVQAQQIGTAFPIWIPAFAGITGRADSGLLRKVK